MTFSPDQRAQKCQPVSSTHSQWVLCGSALSTELMLLPKYIRVLHIFSFVLVKCQIEECPTSVIHTSSSVHAQAIFLLKTLELWSPVGLLTFRIQMFQNLLEHILEVMCIKKKHYNIKYHKISDVLCLALFTIYSHIFF